MAAYMKITAKYPGRCCVCGRAINVGENIEYVKGQPTRHAACTPEVPAGAVHLHGGSGYGCEGWAPGEVVNPQGWHLFISRRLAASAERTACPSGWGTRAATFTLPPPAQLRRP